MYRSPVCAIRVRVNRKEEFAVDALTHPWRETSHNTCADDCDRAIELRFKYLGMFASGSTLAIRSSRRGIRSDDSASVRQRESIHRQVSGRERCEKEVHSVLS